MKSLCLFAISMLFVSNVAVYGQWSKIGFDGQTVSSVSANQINGNIYAVADKKLYKTVNNGINWETLNNGLNNLDVLEVQVDLNGEIYVGTYSGIYLSVNNGISFQNLNTSLPNDFGLYPSVSAIYFLNNSVFIGTSAGVFRSKKNVISWEIFNKNLPREQVNGNMVFFNDYLYLAMDSGIYKTQIDTNNWINCYAGTVNDLAIGGNDLFAGVSMGCPAVRKSSDYGATWEAASSPYGACNGISILCFENSLWVGTFYEGGIQSSNLGKSWGSFNLGPWYSALNLCRRGSSILAGTEYYSYQSGSGGIYIQTHVFTNVKEILQYPEFKTRPGSYDSPVTLSLTVPEAAIVYYTLDGTDPSVQSKIYNKPIIVDSDKLIKTIAINNNGEQSKINTGLYKVKSSDLNTNLQELKSGKLAIYPNPCTTQLNVKISDANSKIDIINVQGKIVRSLTTGNQTKEFLINTVNLESGVYFLRIYAAGNSETFRFVKK